jgi:hypothetical protein
MVAQAPLLNTNIETHDWILTADQMTFMLQHHNFIETAYSEDNLEVLRSLAASQEFKMIFGAMSWDEAYDRYETMG